MAACFVEFREASERTLLDQAGYHRFAGLGALSWNGLLHEIQSVE
jgi:hypothetical protein